MGDSPVERDTKEEEEEEELDFHELLPHLCIGNVVTARNADALTARGITHVINVASEHPNFHPEKFEYLRVALLDNPKQPLTKHFDPVISFIDKVAESSGKVYIHCNAGSSRSGALAVAYIMKTNTWSYADTYKYAKDIRRKIKPNAGFRRELRTFQGTLGLGVPDPSAEETAEEEQEIADFEFAERLQRGEV